MADTHHLSRPAYERLQEELTDLTTRGRVEIARKIETARELGDLSENGDYHAAKEEQGKNEARIRQLKQLLENSQVGAPDAEHDEVAPGRVVTVRFVDFGDEETFLLGSREEAAHASVEVYSPTSPLGQAVLGARIGDTVAYELANGKKVTVEIIAAQPYAG